MKKIVTLFIAFVMVLFLTASALAAETPMASIEYTPGETTEIPLDNGYVLVIQDADITETMEDDLEKKIEELQASDYDLIEADIYNVITQIEANDEYFETVDGIDITFYRDDAPKVIAVLFYIDGQWQNVQHRIDGTAIHCHFRHLCPVAFVFRNDSGNPDDGGDSPETGYPDALWIGALCAVCVCGAVFCFVKAKKSTGKSR